MSTDLQPLNTNQSLQEWSARIKECRNSGMTVSTWCSEQGIRTQTFYYWQKKLFNMVAKQNQPEFSEISMPTDKYASSSPLAKVHVNGFEIDVPRGLDAAELAKLSCAQTMLKDTSLEHIYVACGYTDLRQGIDGLVNLVQAHFNLYPYSSTLFLFCGRRTDRIKALHFTRQTNVFIC